jgi:hypothetical protein
VKRGADLRTLIIAFAVIEGIALGAWVAYVMFWK